MKFGTDGVRGRANVDLTAADALALGRAAGRVLGATRAVVGGDTRVSTPMLDAAVVAGLASEGVEVFRLGVVPTPCVAFEAARLGAIGVVISASHNPYHDNGIKLFAAGGAKLSDADEAAIEAAVVSLPDPDVEPGAIHEVEPTNDDYLDHVHLVLEGRRLDGMRVVVDAANGAASGLARAAFERVGVDVTVVNDSPDGRNINVACGATDPDALSAAVRAAGAEVGLALDGDADRLIAVDERGAVVDGDRIIALCAMDLRDRGELQHDTVVVTVMTNLGFRLAMERIGITVVETAVGDRAVLRALDAGGFSLGGEQSGHVIFRDHASTGDGFLTGLVLLDLVRRSGRPLSELADACMEQLPQVLVNVPVAGRVPDVADLLAGEIGAAERALGATGRVLVRPSGTEPLVRVMVEAATDTLARQVAESLATVVGERFGAHGSQGA